MTSAKERERGRCEGGGEGGGGVLVVGLNERDRIRGFAILCH